MNCPHNISVKENNCFLQNKMHRWIIQNNTRCNNWPSQVHFDFTLMFTWHLWTWYIFSHKITVYRLTPLAKSPWFCGWHMYWLQLNTVWHKVREKAGWRERPFPCEWKQAVKVGGDQDGVNEMMTAGVRGKTPVVIYKPLPCRAEGYTGPCRGKSRRMGQCDGSTPYFTPHGLIHTHTPIN